MKKIAFSLITILIATLSINAAEIAVFPAVGINTDESFVKAVGAILALKYADISGQTVATPRESGKILGTVTDSNYTEAAQNLNVKEYITIDAVGLYLSRKEKLNYSVQNAETKEGAVTVHVIQQSDDDDDDDDESDQELLDKHKTIVTCIRRDVSGNEIYRSQMTLLTYGDIEESSERIAKSLFQKIPVSETISPTSITRREGMGHNKLFQEKLTGVKVGGLYAFDTENTRTLSAMVSIGFNLKMESEKFFVEFGAGAQIPGGVFNDTIRSYGGNYFEIGVSGFPLRNNFLLFTGGGVKPFFNWQSSFEMGLAPYAQIGFISPRTYKSRFYGALVISQNIIPITTEVKYDQDNWNSDDDIIYDYETYPTEIGLQFGIAF